MRCGVLGHPRSSRTIYGCHVTQKGRADASTKGHRSTRATSYTALGLRMHHPPSASCSRLGSRLTKATFASANHYMWTLRPSRFSSLGDAGPRAREEFWHDRVIAATEAPARV
ncbi:hypothetical protein MRX96_047775 [Rhipicephalus microplus]